jgi:hypothetical protein
MRGGEKKPEAGLGELTRELEYDQKFHKGEPMKNNAKVIVMLATIVTACAVSHATPSTQIWIPSTDIQGFGVLHLGWDSYIKTGSKAGDIGTVTNGGITVGVLPFKKIGLEIGIDYRDISSVHQYPMYFNAKLGVPEDAFFKYMPAIAIGGFDFGTQVNSTSYNVTYGLLAKNIWKLGRFSVGGFKGGVGVDPRTVFYVASSTKDTTTGIYAKTDDAGFLLSWDRTMTEISDKLWLAIDYFSGKSGYGALSFGLSYAIVPDASFIVGYDIWNDHDALKPTATVQVDINLPAVQDWFKRPEKK